jgi:hypothetical protein
MRIIDYKTILYYNFRKKIFKKRFFLDKSDFKLNFQQDDQIELNLNNRLFILTGKLHNKFFYYDYEYNEIYMLPETQYSHFCGNLIYIKEINSIYLIGGFNSKKCEIYRNDNLFFNNKSLEVNFNKNIWNNIPDLIIQRQETSCAIINNYLYVFFGLNNKLKANNQNIERINFKLNENWELIQYKLANGLFKDMISISCNGILALENGKILLCGGFDGKCYKDNIYSFVEKNDNINDKNISESNKIFIFENFHKKIPEFSKRLKYLFFKESNFIEIKDYENILNENMPNYANFDSNMNLHLVNTRNFKYTLIPFNEEDE